jgi:hypothetical protein
MFYESQIRGTIWSWMVTVMRSNFPHKVGVEGRAYLYWAKYVRDRNTYLVDTIPHMWCLMTFLNGLLPICLSVRRPSCECGETGYFSSPLAVPLRSIRANLSWGTPNILCMTGSIIRTCFVVYTSDLLLSDVPQHIANSLFCISCAECHFNI